MFDKRGKLRLAAAQALGAGIAFSVATSVFAQQAAQRERIEVTGSNIKRIEGETALPVTVITRYDIEKMGAKSTEDVVRHITANTAMYSDTTQGVGYAVSNANLRGLGASSTLVLLNGRRLANQAFGSIGGFNAAPQAVDLNTIPFSAIERVEVLRDGASAVYGSDAVGGVINFITRSDFTAERPRVLRPAPGRPRGQRRAPTSPSARAISPRTDGMRWSRAASSTSRACRRSTRSSMRAPTTSKVLPSRRRSAPTPDG